MSNPNITWTNGRYFAIGDGAHCMNVSASEVVRHALQTLLQHDECTPFGYTPDQLIEAVRFTGIIGRANLKVPQQHIMGTTGQAAKETALSIEQQALRLLDDQFADYCNNMLQRSHSLRSIWAKQQLAAANARPNAGEHPFVDLTVLPGASHSVISYWQECFHFGEERLTIYDMARDIARLLLAGQELALCGNVLVTVDYLVDMCRIIGTYGSFSATADENFEGSAPLLTHAWLKSIR